MTVEEKLKMYREKKKFIADLNRALTSNPNGHSVNEICYEVWHKESEQFGHDFVEWIIVRYDGGAKSVLHANGNSNTANFRAIGEVLDNGRYSDNYWYDDRQVDLGYKQVNLAKLVLTEVD